MVGVMRWFRNDGAVVGKGSWYGRRVTGGKDGLRSLCVDFL